MPEAAAPPAADARLRVFFALWPDAACAAALHARARQLQQACGGRVMRRDTLHLTLAFLGDVAADRLAALCAAADRIRGTAFELVFDHVGSWHGHRIVWLAPSAVPAPLGTLSEALTAAAAAAELRLEERPFSPHVTLLRHARHAPPQDGDASPLRWRVGSFVLVASELHPEGARYGIVRRWKLAAQAGRAADS